VKKFNLGEAMLFCHKEIGDRYNICTFLLSVDRQICIGFEPLQSRCTYTLWPFVPCYLISAQESPVPLPKFQMAPRLKILISSGSKKGNRIYCPFF